jgi:hypothetical protein
MSTLVPSTVPPAKEEGHGLGWWCCVSVIVSCILCALCTIGGTISGAFTIAMMFEMLESLFNH